MPQPISPALNDIQDPTSPASTLIVALKTLKNEVVGHEQRKELVIKQGIVPCLTNILAHRNNGSDTAAAAVSTEHGSALGSGLIKPKEGSPFYQTTKANGKRRSAVETGGSRGKTYSRRKSTDLWNGNRRSSNVDSDLYPGLLWTEEDEVRLQITILVGSLGHGGSTFVSPLTAGGIAAPLVSACNTSTHPRLLTATLETLLVLANAIAFRQSRIDTTDSPFDATEKETATAFAQEIYAKNSIKSLVNILAQLSSAETVKKQILLVSQLIARTCKTNQHRNLLLKVGALDQLVARFAATAVFVDGKNPEHANLDLPPPVDKDGLFLLLEAITTIIQYSDYRTMRFLYSPDVLSVFASATKLDVNPDAYKQDHIDPTILGKRSNSSFSLGISLPQIQPAHIKGDRAHHDAYLANYTTPGFSNQPRMEKTQPATQRVINGNNCDGLFAWLIDLARKERRYNRLITIWTLTLVTGVMEKISLSTWTEYTFRNLDRSLALLIIPLLMNMIDESNAAISEQKQVNSSIAWTSPLEGVLSTHMTDLNRTIKECAPTVLAVLIEGSPTLQKAAVEAGAIKKLCQALKKTFDPTSSERKSLWTPNRTTPANLTSSDDSSAVHATSVDATVKLGQSGLSPEALHALKCRRSTLQALAAIANKEDAYRKVIIENGVVSCIIDSLVPFSDERSDASEHPVEANRPPIAQQKNTTDNNTNNVFLGNNHTTNVKGGNPAPVLVGACNTARAMSRSVSILRTSLIDAGVARPIYNLVKHPDEEVQIAATDVMCNLLLEVSPMREELIEAGAMETLCVHAHKNNASIREISLWALKHLVLAAPNEIRINCLNRLGPQWLMQIISEESEAKATNQFDPTYYNGHNQPQLGMGTPNAAGEQVDLLNAVEGPYGIGDNYIMHSDDDLEERYSDVEDASEEPASFRSSIRKFQNDHQKGSKGPEVPTLIRTWSSVLRQLSPHQRMLLRATKLPEQKSSVLTRRNNLRVQEQGLDFIRNLITSKGAFEMIDYVMGALGSHKFFEVLCLKLTPMASEQPFNPFCMMAESTALTIPGTFKSPIKKPISAGNNDGLTFQGHYQQRHQHYNRTTNHALSGPRYLGPPNGSGIAAEKYPQPVEDQTYSQQRQDHINSNIQRPLHPEGSFQQHRQQNLSPSYHQRQPQQDEQQRYLLHGHQFPELLLTTIFILVHIAAGTPRHRSILIGEHALLRSLLPFFSHSDRRLRVACVWFVSNLTWVDNASDAPAARIRALELRALGFEERLRVAASDSDLDVRERAKTALDQCAKLLGGPPLSAPGSETGPSNNNTIAAAAAAAAAGMAIAPTLPMNISSTSHPAVSASGALIGPVFGSSAPGTPGTNSSGAAGASSGNGSLTGSGRPTFGRQL